MKLVCNLGIAWVIGALSVIHCQEPTTTTPTNLGVPSSITTPSQGPSAGVPPTPDTGALPSGAPTPAGNSSEEEQKQRNSRALFGMSMVHSELQKNMAFLFDFAMDNMGRMAETCGCNKSALERFLPPRYGRPDVPPGPGGRPNGPRPDGGDRPGGPRPDGGDRPGGPRPDGGDRPGGPRPDGGDRPGGPRPDGGDRPGGPRPDGGDRPGGPRPDGSRPDGNRQGTPVPPSPPLRIINPGGANNDQGRRGGNHNPNPTPGSGNPTEVPTNIG